MSDTVGPAFVFIRDRDAERNSGYLFAGKLIIDRPKHAEFGGEQVEFVAHVMRLVKAKEWKPKHVTCCGWLGGYMPSNAIDVDDPETLLAWAENKVAIEIRQGPYDVDDHIAGHA
jgi:hypothetical protein